jgi:hypothetical protein
MNLREVPMKYGRFVVFIRLDPSEICRLVSRENSTGCFFLTSPGVFGDFVACVSSPNRPI